MDSCMEANPLPTQMNLRLVQPDTAVPPPEPSAPRTRRERPRVGRVVVRPCHAWYVPCKNALDFTLALGLAVIALPLVLLAALLVKLTSRGPAFYTQTRLGRDGRLFTIYKIRTMIHNRESLTGPRWSMPGDPRVTPLGWFLHV